MLALLLQFGAIYFFNAISKDGAAWRDGSAVHYALHLDKYVTPLGLFMRDEMLKEMGLVNTYAGALVPWLASVMGIFMVRQYALTIPDELLEAARIDGAGEARIFLRIVMPLMGPSIATLIIFTFTWSWNAFLWPLIVIKSSSLFTLPLGLSSFLDMYDIEYGPLMAGMTITVLPMIVAFLALQRYFIKGMALTGMKV